MKKLLISLFISLNIFSMEIKEIKKDTFVLKDSIDIQNTTESKAKEQLLQYMRAELLKQVNGVNVNTASLLDQDSTGKSRFNIFSEESADGIILEEKINSEKKTLVNNMFTIELEVQMEVGKQKGIQDSTYQMKVSNLKSIYNDGDKLELTIETSKDSFIYIFIRDENKKIYQYFPNEINKTNFIKTNEKLTFPENKNYSIILSSGDKTETLENLIVLASKEPFNLLGLNYDNNYGVKTGEFKDLMKQIIKMDKSMLIKYSDIYKVVRE